jgi:large subunit ribosomal protein L16
MKRYSRLLGVETRGCKLEFGDYGIRAIESGWITARQIEAARVAISRYAKRGGKLWIKIFPDKPMTKKAAETRMGSGKGSPEYWVAEVRAGRILYEVVGISKEIAFNALELAVAKLPLKCKIVERSEFLI